MVKTAKISFDCSGYGYDEAEWDQTCHKISMAMESAGLPSLYGNAWKESDGSCVFEGSIKDVVHIREILSKYPVTIWEEGSMSSKHTKKRAARNEPKH